MKILVTGAAGFIGMHTCLKLLERGNEVVGLDNINDYYDRSLKDARLALLAERPGFRFLHADIENAAEMQAIFGEGRFDRVIHLAAQPGVRYSLANPHAYVNANVQGFLNILEGCRHHPVESLTYASSSSVYGGYATLPFHESQNIAHPISLYAATKKANELMAHTYSHLFRIPTTGLRFFTVYGPWGRPDMAPMLFAKAISEGRAIDIFNNGDMLRDFTYIDDIVEGVVRVSDKPATPDPGYDPAQPDPSISNAPYRIFNIGNSQPVKLMDFIAALEKAMGREAMKNFLPMQPGDVPATSSDTTALESWVGFNPNTPIETGVERFVDWYKKFYRINS
ncbi:NAD-dependent epimerase [Gellertiella hungarica]|uniref:UDP-glucuronate 4-epimerase n=1 Tax=Gellertiella hungarica TaxID=1572859 RepID=A0A7W6NKE0_9HYPH|nr:NAD-dependent epimerase [Gellertiella hungarica]MBB4064207.1 UDP-glucuronate 4-epimerase [Gellertiella hungarica]